IKLLILYILNVLDFLFTFFLLNTGLFQEINPFMINVMSHTGSALLLKIMLPAFLLLYLSIRFKSATPHQLKVSNYFINAMNVIYLMILASHILWCILALGLCLYMNVIL
ncbi:MAG: DUF5658 family protein, partial [Niameybacter sp.]